MRGMFTNIWGKIEKAASLRLDASYTVEGSFVFGIAILLIAGGIILGFKVCKGNLDCITTTVQSLPQYAGTSAADGFRLVEFANEVKDMLTEGR